MQASGEETTRQRDSDCWSSRYRLDADTPRSKKKWRKTELGGHAKRSSHLRASTPPSQISDSSGPIRGVVAMSRITLIRNIVACLPVSAWIRNSMCLPEAGDGGRGAKPDREMPFSCAVHKSIRSLCPKIRGRPLGPRSAPRSRSPHNRPRPRY